MLTPFVRELSRASAHPAIKPAASLSPPFISVSRPPRRNDSRPTLLSEARSGVREPQIPPVW
jgi:hypothetical protein